MLRPRIIVVILRIMLATADLQYSLDPARIATRPAEPRDSARLLVVSRSNPAARQHLVFNQITDLLNPGDLLVTNRTRVLPARISARREDTGGKVQGLFLSAPAPNTWRCLLKSNGRLRSAQRLILQDNPPITAELIERDEDAWLLRIEAENPDPHAILSGIGATPLPPYITAARRASEIEIDDALDRDWYQCVYADRGASVAAPTAGLHFTPKLLSRLEAKGIATAEVTLDVGAGTFKPIETESVEDHPIHTERYLVPEATRRAIEQTRAAGNRVVAVGTTTARALESIALNEWAGADGCGGGGVWGGVGGWGATNLMILPGYQFQAIDALITNFHQPRSTLLALVAALLPEGLPRILDLYAEAARLEYRFFSYGDAMLFLP